VSFETLTEDGQRLGRRHVIWQIVPGPTVDNGKSPVGWRRLSTWSEALADGWWNDIMG